MTYPNDDTAGMDLGVTGVATVTKFWRPNPQTGVMEECDLSQLSPEPGIIWQPPPDPMAALACIGDVSRLNQKLDVVLERLDHVAELEALRKLDRAVREFLDHSFQNAADTPDKVSAILRAISDVNEARGVK